MRAALLADADSGFQIQTNIVAALFSARGYFANPFRIGKRFVDGCAEFLYQFFELLVHMVLQFRPRSPPQARQRESLDFRQCHLGAVCNIRYPKATPIEFVAYLIDA
jgi:hypothetical protein